MKSYISRAAKIYRLSDVIQTSVVSVDDVFEIFLRDSNSKKIAKMETSRDYRHFLANFFKETETVMRG